MAIHYILFCYCWTGAGPWTLGNGCFSFPITRPFLEAGLGVLLHCRDRTEIKAGVEREGCRVEEGVGGSGLNAGAVLISKRLRTLTQHSRSENEEVSAWARCICFMFSVCTGPGPSARPLGQAGGSRKVPEKGIEGVWRQTAPGCWTSAGREVPHAPWDREGPVGHLIRGNCMCPQPLALRRRLMAAPSLLLPGRVSLESEPP